MLTHASICAFAALKPPPTSLSEVIGAPSGEALNDCEMLMQLIREAKSREGRWRAGGVNEEGGPGGVKRRAEAKIKSAQGEGKGTNQLQVSESLRARGRLFFFFFCRV